MRETDPTSINAHRQASIEKTGASMLENREENAELAPGICGSCVYDRGMTPIMG